MDDIHPVHLLGFLRIDATNRSEGEWKTNRMHWNRIEISVHYSSFLMKEWAKVYYLFIDIFLNKLFFYKF